MARQSGECAYSHGAGCAARSPLPGRGIPTRSHVLDSGLDRPPRPRSSRPTMPDTDAILTRLGLDPASMRDGDLEVRTPITGEPIARLTTATPTEVDAAVVRAT